MIITNKPRLCAVEIECSQTDFSQNDVSAITGVRIKRREANEVTATLIGEVQVVNVNDLHFVAYDITARSHRHYEYFCIPVLGSTEGVGSVEEVDCEFSALFVGNLSKQYVAALNTKFSNKRQYGMTYAQTYYSRYPHAVRNGSMNYSSGSVSGLFLDKTPNGEFTIQNAQEYKEGVIDFLSDGNWKLVKTGEGHLWYVQVDGELQEDYSEFAGASTITFNWTEIGKVTDEGIVVVE